MLRLIVPALAALMLLGACQKEAQSDTEPAGKKIVVPPALTLTSAAFANGGAIPRVYTCDSADISPALSWTGIPDEAQSLALIVDDPDAPGQTWVHWVMYDIPVADSTLAEGIPGEPELPNGARQAINDFGKYGYGGPCPPNGEHRYFFKLYALDNVPVLPDKATKHQLILAMDGHILAQSQMIGTYSRSK